ncbi:hypothetical protein, partial [Salmonella enterica]|uniref:hypothetical protein n=1 Tax=Salmonella enterica TaxID=28901 RepID=UPI003296E70D
MSDDILVKYTGKQKKYLKSWLSNANEITLEERLGDIVKGAMGYGFRGMMPQMIKDMADTRNSFVHKEYGKAVGELDLA